MAISQEVPPSVSICGFDILTLLPDEVLAEVLRRIESGEGARLTTFNVEMVSRSKRDAGYREIMQTSDLMVPDGMPIVWASQKRLGEAKTLERVTGVDLTKRLLETVPANRIAIIGGVDPAQTLQILDVPNRESIHVDNGMMKADEATYDRIAAEIGDRRLVFLALGVPKQDHFAVALRKRLPHAVLIPNGGSFELLGGMIPRAPAWMQNNGFEWLFRLTNNPKRLWRRYLVEYWPGVIALIKDSRRKVKA